MLGIVNTHNYKQYRHFIIINMSSEMFFAMADLCKVCMMFCGFAKKKIII